MDVHVSCTPDRTPDVLRADARGPRYLCDNNLHRPTRREQSRKNTSFLAADEVIQTTRTFELHIFFSVLSTLRNPQDIISHGNINLSHSWLCQGIEHTIPPQSRSPIVPRVKSPPAVSSCKGKVKFVTFVHEMFVSKTQQMHFCARIHDQGQMFGLITCSEHVKFLTNHITSGPGERRESRRLGRLGRSTWETRHLSRSPPELPCFPSLHRCSQEVPRQVMTKPGVSST